VFFKRDDGERVSIHFGERSIRIDCSCDLVWRFGSFTDYRLEGNRLCLVHCGYAYGVELRGCVRATEDGIILSGESKEIVF